MAELMTRPALPLLVTILLAVSTAGAEAPAADPLELLQLPFREVTRRCAGAVVRVAPDRPGLTSILTRTPISGGPQLANPPPAGVAIGPEWVLTRGIGSVGRQVRLATSDGRLLRGEVAGRISDPPVALVRVPGANLVPLPVGSSCASCVGSWVLIVGNSFGTGTAGEPPATLGLLSGRRTRKDRPPLLVVSAAANPGDAGGAVVDTSGRLIGIVTGRRTSGDLAEVAPVDDVLERLGEVKGFTPPEMTEKALQGPGDVVSRHLCRLAERLRPTVVSLVVQRTSKAARTRAGPVRDGRSFFPRFPVQDRAVTGFLLDAEGTVVTAYANLADAKGRLADDDGKSLLASVRAVLSDGSTHPARLVGAHEGKGIAVLKLEGPEATPAPELGRGRDLGLGRWLVTFGNPFGTEKVEAPLIGFGILSDRSTNAERYDAFLTDAPINLANVGGPVVDMEGRIVGVAIVSISPQDAILPYGLNSGIGFVIPIEDVLELVPMLEADGVVRFRPGFLGVRLAEEGGDGGVKVLNVIPGTGAARGGLRAGDVIQSLNGMTITNGTVLRRILYGLAPKTKVSLGVRRGEEILSLEIELSLRPEFRE
jgi:S1-C subfamily serine protease